MPKYADPALEAEYQRVLLYKRVEKRRLAHDNMLVFSQLMDPDPEEPSNPDASLFEATPLARMLCQIIERADRGENKRICISVGPQMGKSQVLSRNAPAWLSGRNPKRNMMLCTYNDSFAAEFGGDVREITRKHEYQQVFPKHAWRQGSEAKDLLITTGGGKMAFVGVGGSGSGKPADFLFIDDPFKNDEDAQSDIYREKVWSWFNRVGRKRLHKDSVIVIIHTRWHEDDLIGRLCDPEHPERNKKYKGISEGWTYYNLPVIIEDPELAKALGLTLEVPQDALVREQFGTKPMASLWERRKPLTFLAEDKQSDVMSFNALYMGKPSPDEGSYFHKGDIVEYHSMDELPKQLTKYGASDHAVSEKQKADSTVAGVVGVDEDEDIWVLPDLVWEKMESDKIVESLITLMRAHKPDVWWMESELISKSFGPFLIKRMTEENVYTTIDPKTPSKSKRTRARAIQGRMRQRKVHFPAFAPWFADAKKQMLKFDNGTNDDFVDFISWIGLGLTQEYGAPKTKPEKVIKHGTFAWIKQASNARQRKERIEKASAGW